MRTILLKLFIISLFIIACKQKADTHNIKLTEKIPVENFETKNEVKKLKKELVDTVKKVIAEEKLSRDLIVKNKTPIVVNKKVKNKKTVTVKTSNNKLISSTEVSVKLKKENKIKQEVEVVKNEKLSHKVFDTFLKKQVSSSGVVDYKGIKANQVELDKYINLLQINTIDNTWTRNEKLAYWINAYNAFTIKLIIDNYPVNSIKDIEGGKPWDKKWIKLQGTTYSLNDIENSIIRPQFNEPRIHFAINCAAKSCPKLGNFAYESLDLNSKLENQTKKFINQVNTITENSIKISKIFEWYAKDFGNIVSFFQKYSTILIQNDAEISYLEYDWRLNEN